MLPSPSSSPGLAPPSVIDLTPDQRFQAWVAWMKFSEQFLLAGLRHQIGPDGDLIEAVREWYRQDRAGHDKKIAHLLEELWRRERGSLDGG